MGITIPKLLCIDWIDSKGTTTGWEYRNELEPLPPVRCTTVGYVLEDTAEYTTLAQTVSDTQVLGRITIPRRAILKRRALR